MEFVPESAKQFLLLKVTNQAQRDRVPLDETEKKMFFFSESPATSADVVEAFDNNYDATTYEKKVAGLLRKAYARDKRTKEGKGEWKDALSALKMEDFYGLVMVDQAGIARSKEALRSELWRFELEWLPFEIIELVAIVLGFLVVFRPSVLRLYLPDWIRWFAYPLFVWLVWYIGRVWGRMQTARAIKRSKVQDR